MVIFTQLLDLEILQMMTSKCYYLICCSSLHFLACLFPPSSSKIASWKRYNQHSCATITVSSIRPLSYQIALERLSLLGIKKKSIHLYKSQKCVLMYVCEQLVLCLNVIFFSIYKNLSLMFSICKYKRCLFQRL